MKRDRIYQITALCFSHNQATSPYVHRTDHEHDRQVQRARAIRNRLRLLGAIEGRDYREWDSGRYWPI